MHLTFAFESSGRIEIAIDRRILVERRKRAAGGEHEAGSGKALQRRAILQLIVGIQRQRALRR